MEYWAYGVLSPALSSGLELNPEEEKQAIQKGQFLVLTQGLNVGLYREPGDLRAGDLETRDTRSRHPGASSHGVTCESIEEAAPPMLRGLHPISASNGP